MQTIIINEPGLNCAQHYPITVTADSTVELVKYDGGYNTFYALLIDGRHYNMVMWKHTIGRPEHMEALDRALQTVQDAIDALQPAPVAEAIAVADILDQLVIAVEVARVNAVGNMRWLNALEAGYDWLIQQDTISYDITSHELTVPSASTEGKSYHANGACQCQAFETHNACWHRAASRLVRRALEVPIVRTQRPKPTPAEKARINAEMAELFA